MPLTYTYTDNTKWGAGIGGPLSEVQHNENIWTLYRQIIDGLAAIPQGVGIDTFTVSGSQLTVWLTNGQTRGPFTLPTAVFRWRNTWTPATAYFKLDFFKVDGLGLFIVLIDHTSAATFNPDAVDGLGNPIYRQLFGWGVTGVETVSGATQTPAYPAASGKYHRCTNAGGCAVTIPPNSTHPFPLGTVITYEQEASGVVTFAGGTGVTLNYPPSRAAKTAELHAVVSAVKKATDTWTLSGYLGVP